MLGGIREETYNLLFKDKELLQEDKESENNILNDRILSEIELFNTLNENERKEYEKKFDDVDFSKISWDKGNKRYNYNASNRKITFRRLSDIIETKDFKEELLSFKRYKKCHSRLLILITMMSKPAILLNGTYVKKGKKCLHSIIELQNKDGNEIVDYNMNLIMPKQQYIELTQFKVIEAIKDLDHLNDIREGIENQLINMGLTLKPYFMFRKELKVDIEKNKRILKEVDNESLNKRIDEVKKQREEFEK